MDARVGTAGDIVVENDDAQGTVRADEAVSCASGGSVVLDTTSMWAGVRHTVSGQIVARSGRVVAGETVRVLRPGARALERRTSSTGRFSFMVRPSSGSSRVRIVVPDCDGVDTTIGARRAPTCRSIAVTPSGLQAWKATRLRVRLRVAGKAIGLARVRIRGAGVDEVVRTGPDGRARVLVRPTRPGIVSITAPAVASCTRQVGVVAAASARQLTG